MTFSVVVPVFNVAEYLPACLDSLLSQDYGSWEALCVDDGSTDDSGRILDEYAARDARIRVVHQDNAGVSAARNVAQRMAEGDWLMYLDADDIYLPGALRVVSDLLHSATADLFVLTDVLFFSGECACPPCRACKIVDHDSSPWALYVRHMMRGFPCLRVARRVKYASVDFPLGIKMMEDLFHLCYCLNVPGEMAFVKGTVSGVRERKNSASNDSSWRRAQEVVRTLREILAYVRGALRATQAEEAIVRKRFKGVVERYVCGCFAYSNRDMRGSTACSRRAFADAIKDGFGAILPLGTLTFFSRCRLAAARFFAPLFVYLLIDWAQFVCCGIRARVRRFKRG